MLSDMRRRAVSLAILGVGSFLGLPGATAEEPAAARIDRARLSQVKEVARLEGHSALVRSLAWSPDGAILLSGAADLTARTWEGSTGRLLATVKGHT
jgi:WD40 repeat protein